MFVEKKTFGQPPFCSRALTSVPGAPPPSFATVSQPDVAKPGVEICVPLCVAVALVSTFQPFVAPRFEIAEEPVGGSANAVADDAVEAAAMRLCEGAEDPNAPLCCNADAAAKPSTTATVVSVLTR